jgi:glutaminyl-tRNA synthetase
MITENKASQPPVAADLRPSDFIRDIVAADLATHKYRHIHTRFPPEPNGYLHIGHAKSICLNFGIAREFGGTCNLRYDDTNPTKEELEYVDSILQDVNWLISGWAEDRLGLKPTGKTPEVHWVNGTQDYYLPAITKQASRLSHGSEGNSVTDEQHCRPKLEPFYASDYFDQICEYAFQLISKGAAYVCDLPPQELAKYRGAPDGLGKDSPFRNRSIEDNLELFARMKNGEFPPGKRTLRAKIDMASPNIWLRDPVLYRICDAQHHHTAGKWWIYPMYDFAHCLSDYIEGITHSICTLEFEVHRPLYEWILENLDLPRSLPRQFEFARLSLSYTVMSKRKLMRLVTDGLVSGWDDPRMPTLSGLRRRGVRPNALRQFAYNVGITKYNGLTDVAVLEHAIRQDLNKIALRRLAVLRPIKVVITNYPEDKIEELEAVNNPEDPSAGIRKIAFSRTLYIEQEDFMEIPPPNYFRLSPGSEVRLKYAYIIKCREAMKDASGKIFELHCIADLDSKTGGATAARKVKAAIHWVSAAHAIEAEVRIYDRLFTVPDPDATGNFKSMLNPKSLKIVTAKCEPHLRNAVSDVHYQFERVGYFVLDKDSLPEKLVFNRTIALKDSWAKPGGNLLLARSAASARTSESVKQNGLCLQSGAQMVGSPGSAVRFENGRKKQLDKEPLRTVEHVHVKGGQPFKHQVVVKGQQLEIDAVRINNVLFSVSGRVLRIARVCGEYYNDIGDPQVVIQALKAAAPRVDLLTFIQRPPHTRPQHSYHLEWEGIAALPLNTFDYWWNHQIAKEARRKIEKATKAGVEIRHVTFDDDLVRGIVKIYNEIPVKRGKRNWHYGSDFATVKVGLGSELDRSEFIAAYFEEELIGFVKLLYAGSLASPVVNLSMVAHRDKMTNSALMAEIVRSSLRKNISFVFYGIWKTRRHGMREFLESNGFKQVDVPRFYVPLTIWGEAGLRIGMHKGLQELLPERVILFLLALRSKWYALKHTRESKSRSGGEKSVTFPAS